MDLINKTKPKQGFRLKVNNFFTFIFLLLQTRLRTHVLLGTETSRGKNPPKNLQIIWMNFMYKPSKLFRCEVLVNASDTLSYELLLHSSKIVPQKNIQTIKDLSMKEKKKKKKRERARLD